MRYNNIRDQKLSNLEEYTTDHREKEHEEEKRNEIEDEINKKEKEERIQVENDAAIKTLELYAIQR